TGGGVLQVCPPPPFWPVDKGPASGDVRPITEVAHLGHCLTGLAPAPDPPSRLWQRAAIGQGLGRRCSRPYAAYLWGRANVYRRLKPASLALALLPLCQAWHLGGLRRASPVPFRASSVTNGFHPPAATAQRHAGRLYGRQSYGLAPFRSFHPRAFASHVISVAPSLPCCYARVVWSP